jgi:hypothetical protein
MVVDCLAHARVPEQFNLVGDLRQRPGIALCLKKNLAIWFAIITSFSGCMLDLGLALARRRCDAFDAMRLREDLETIRTGHPIR